MQLSGIESVCWQELEPHFEAVLAVSRWKQPLNSGVHFLEQFLGSISWPSNRQISVDLQCGQ